MNPNTELSPIRPEEAAKIPGCSVVYIYKLARRGELPSSAFGRSVRFHPGGVDYRDPSGRKIRRIVSDRKRVADAIWAKIQVELETGAYRMVQEPSIL